MRSRLRTTLINCFNPLQMLTTVYRLSYNYPSRNSITDHLKTISHFGIFYRLEKGSIPLLSAACTEPSESHNKRSTFVKTLTV